MSSWSEAIGSIKLNKKAEASNLGFLYTIENKLIDFSHDADDAACN